MWKKRGGDNLPSRKSRKKKFPILLGAVQLKRVLEEWVIDAPAWERK